jgi:hypothetical protein
MIMQVKDFRTGTGKRQPKRQNLLFSVVLLQVTGSLPIPHPLPELNPVLAGRE